jgi:DNA-binding response OmpR family regulator
LEYLFRLAALARDGAFSYVRLKDFVRLGRMRVSGAPAWFWRAAMPANYPAKILVAEDDALIAMSIREVLSLFGFEVVGVAATVNDALCIAQNSRPDLAIFDVQLAGKRDGIEGASLLRTILDIPVVFLTAQTDEGTRARAAAVQPSAYVCKPASPQQIVTAVEGALRQMRDQHHASGG